MDIEGSTRGFLTAFFRQSGAFMLVSTLIFTAGLSYLLLTKPVYESKGSLVVKFGQDARPEAASDGKAPMQEEDANARQEIIRSYIKIIFSRDMLRDIVNEFGVYSLYPDLQKELKKGIPAEEVALNMLLEDDLKVSYDQSHVIEVAVRNVNAKVAADFASRVMEAFARKRTEIYNAPQTDFLQQQTAEARQKHEQAQKNFQNFKQEAGISAIDEELAQLLREKSELNALAYAAITEAQKRLTELETREAEMRSTYRAESPFLIRLQQTVAVARSDLERRQSDLNSAGSGSSLGTRIANADKRVAYLESKRGRYNDLQQQIKINEENYLYYLKRGEESRINNLLTSQNITRIAVMDKPVVAVKPLKPKKSIFMVVTMLAALVAGAGVSLSRELMDDRLSNPEQVYASLGIPVFASFEKESF